MQTSYCIRIGIPPFKVVSALPTEHSPSFQAWSSLPKYRWIASVPQIQMRGLCTITKQHDNTPTSPSFPPQLRWSPIQVLTRLNIA